MSWSSILGQDRAVERLKSLLGSRRIPPALLFHGPEGIGKAPAAFEFAKTLNCRTQGADACGACASCSAADKGVNMDIKRLDAEYQAGVLGEEAAKQQHLKIDSIRHLVKDMEMRSLLGGWKTAVVIDAHTMQPAAANALLKALEEPPPRSLWILVTARRELLLPTIASRCQAIPFFPLPPRIVESILASKEVPASDIPRLAAMAEGSPGRALALWKAKLPEPSEWLSDPLAPFRLAEELPRELHLSRPLVEAHLYGMSWHLRLRRGMDADPDSKTRRAIQSLETLRRHLKSNADPRLVLELAALELQRA